MKRDPWYWQRWVFGQRVGNPVRKLILTALAAKAESATGYCYAAQDELAGYAECDERTVRRHLGALEEAGLLARRHEYRSGGGRLADGFLLLDGRATFWPDGAAIPDTVSATAYRTEEATIPDRAVSALQPSSTTLGLSEERARPAVKLRGKKVPPAIVEIGERLLGAFNASAGRELRCYAGTGEASEALKRILSRLVENPEVAEERLVTMVSNVVANPPSWVEGPVDVGDIFGPRAFTRALSNGGQPTGRAARDQAKEQRRARRRESVDKLMGSS